MKEKDDSLDIEFRPDAVSEAYSNFVIITHSPTEFVFDFAQIAPGYPKPFVRNRVIMSPEHTKRLLAALTENINKFENQFGEIRERDETFIPKMGGRQLN